MALVLLFGCCALKSDLNLLSCGCKTVGFHAQRSEGLPVFISLELPELGEALFGLSFYMVFGITWKWAHIGPILLNLLVSAEIF